MKIIVTGGAGFIGSALVRHILNYTKHKVLNLDKLSYASSLSSLDSIKKNPRYLFKRTDICKREKLRIIFKNYKPDIIMNLAAETHVDRSIDNPSIFLQTNILGTFNLLEESRLYWNNLIFKKKKLFRFHHISTDEVFGDLPHPDKISTKSKLSSFNENSRYNPSSPYSASKASSDHLVRAWMKTYDLPILITNSSNNYGPYSFPEKLIPLIILNAIEGKSLPVYGDGNQIRDWLYVEDHAKALILTAIKGKIGETYNIGGNNEKRNIDVVKIICRVLNKIFPVKKNNKIRHLKIRKYEDLISHVVDRPGHDLRYAIDASKIKKNLGWYPKESFETGIRKTVIWYLNNLDWCKKIQKGNYLRKRLGIKK